MRTYLSHVCGGPRAECGAEAVSLHSHCYYWYSAVHITGFPSSPAVKNPPTMQEPQEMWLRSLGQEEPLEEGMATHSSILAWRIPQTENPDGPQSTGSQKVGHD